MAREYKKITYEDYKAACRDYKNITDEDFKAAWNLIDYLGLLKQRSLVSYTSRDYNSLVKEFWNCVSYLTDLWSPEDHYWKRPMRIWLRSLWWYVHFSWCNSIEV